MAEDDVLEVLESTDAPATDDAPETTMRIPVVKAGKGYMVEVDLEKIPIEVYRDALFRGLKLMVNSRMSKQSSTKDLTGKELDGTRAAVMAQANANLEAIYEGKIRKSAAVKEKSEVPQAVMAEARRIAKIKIKDALKKKGVKVSLIPAAKLTAGAKKFIEEHPEVIEFAKRNIAKRDEGLEDIDVGGISDLKEDETLKAKAEARAKTRRKPSKAEDAEEVNTPRGRKGNRGEAHA